MFYEEVVRACRDLACPIARHHLFPWYAPHDCTHFEHVAALVGELFKHFFGRNPHRVEHAIAVCAAYLHDVGMHLLPREINELQIHASWLRAAGQEGENIVKRCPEFFTGCKGSRAGCTTENAGIVHIDDGMQGACLDPNSSAYTSKECQSTRSKISYFVRKIHPWISQAFVEKELPLLLSERVSMGLAVAQMFAGIVGKIVALHAGGTTFASEEKVFQGYKINLGKFGALVTLADAIDVTRHIYAQGRLKTIFEADLSQVKHHVFKRFFESVEVRGGAIVFTMRPGIGRAEALGALYFEIGTQVAKDYERTHNIHALPIVVKAGKRVELDSKRVAEVKNFAELLDLKCKKDKCEKCRNTVKQFCEELDRIAIVNSEAQKLVPQCRESTSLECEKKEPQCEEESKYVTPFDVLATSILFGLRTDGFADIIDREAPIKSKDLGVI